MSAQGWVGASLAMAAKKVEVGLPQADQRSGIVEESWIMVILSSGCRVKASPP